jgi:hypothetical protein
MHTPDHVVERLRDWRSRFIGTPLGWALTFVLAAVGVYFLRHARRARFGSPAVPTPPHVPAHASHWAWRRRSCGTRAQMPLGPAAHAAFV